MKSEGTLKTKKSQKNQKGESDNETNQKGENVMHVATATATGSAHTNVGQPGKINNQDAIVTLNHEKGFITVLCDGCGSQPKSETGADIGAHIIAKEVIRHLIEKNYQVKLNWSKITREVTRAIKDEVAKFAADDSITAFEQAVMKRFLFTAMVLLVVDDSAVIVSFGDGVMIVDEEIVNIEPPIENAPPYIGYRLIRGGSYRTEELKPHLMFSVVKIVKLSELKKGIIVGTDGLGYLLNEDFHHPALVQPKALQRWLNVQTAEKVSKDSITQSRCRDDVSIVIVRTNEAQKVLFDSRKKIAELKRLMETLEKEIGDFSDDLNRSNMLEQEAKNKIKPIEASLDVVMEKSERLNTFVTRVDGMKTRLETLRSEIPKKAKKPFVHKPFAGSIYGGALGQYPGQYPGQKHFPTLPLDDDEIPFFERFQTLAEAEAEEMEVSPGIVGAVMGAFGGRKQKKKKKNVYVNTSRKSGGGGNRHGRR